MQLSMGVTFYWLVDLTIRGWVFWGRAFSHHTCRLLIISAQKGHWQCLAYEYQLRYTLLRDRGTFASDTRLSTPSKEQMLSCFGPMRIPCRCQRQGMETDVMHRFEARLWINPVKTASLKRKPDSISVSMKNYCLLRALEVAEANKAATWHVVRHRLHYRAVLALLSRLEPKRFLGWE